MISNITLIYFSKLTKHLRALLQDVVFSGSKGVAEEAYQTGQQLAERLRMDVEVTVDNVNGILAELIEDSACPFLRKETKTGTRKETFPPPSYFIRDCR